MRSAATACNRASVACSHCLPDRWANECPRTSPCRAISVSLQARQQHRQAPPFSTSSAWASSPDSRRANTIIQSWPADSETCWFRSKNALARLMLRPRRDFAAAGRILASANFVRCPAAVQNGLCPLRGSPAKPWQIQAQTGLGSRGFCFDTVHPSPRPGVGSGPQHGLAHLGCSFIAATATHAMFGSRQASLPGPAYACASHWRRIKPDPDPPICRAGRHSRQT